MLGHLRRRPTQRSSATPICPTGGDGTGRWLCLSTTTMARHGCRLFASKRFADSTPSRSPQASPYLWIRVLRPQSKDNHAWNHTE